MYVIVNKKTQIKLTHPRTGKSSYKQVGPAIAQAKKYVKENPSLTLTVMKQDEYVAQIPTKIVTNIMTGVQVEIPADTPPSCDPSTELYHSM